jgi:hypothetical protein
MFFVIIIYKQETCLHHPSVSTDWNEAMHASFEFNELANHLIPQKKSSVLLRLCQSLADPASSISEFTYRRLQLCKSLREHALKTYTAIPASKRSTEKQWAVSFETGMKPALSFLVPGRNAMPLTPGTRALLSLAGYRVHALSLHLPRASCTAFPLVYAMDLMNMWSVVFDVLRWPDVHLFWNRFEVLIPDLVLVHRIMGQWTEDRLIAVCSGKAMGIVLKTLSAVELLMHDFRFLTEPHFLNNFADVFVHSLLDRCLYSCVWTEAEEGLRLLQLMSTAMRHVPTSVGQLEQQADGKLAYTQSFAYRLLRLISLDSAVVEDSRDMTSDVLLPLSVPLWMVVCSPAIARGRGDAMLDAASKGTLDNVSNPFDHAARVAMSR